MSAHPRPATAPTARWRSPAPTRTRQAAAASTTRRCRPATALDGVVDGLISNQNRCNADLRPGDRDRSTARRCAAPDGADTGDTCLSDAQITALKGMNTSTQLQLPAGQRRDRLPGLQRLGRRPRHHQQPEPAAADGDLPEPRHRRSRRSRCRRTAPYISRQTDAVIRYCVTRDARLRLAVAGPREPRPLGRRASASSAPCSTCRSNLDAFAAKGGKLLLAHGLRRRAGQLARHRGVLPAPAGPHGPGQVDRFVRYYEVPGYGHAVSTTFNAAWDSLTTLENWVRERHRAAGAR